jgi:hypothetical protein
MVRAGIQGGAEAFLAAFGQVFGPAEGAFAGRLRAADCKPIWRCSRTDLALMSCCHTSRRHAVSMRARPTTSISRQGRGASAFPARLSCGSPVSTIARPLSELTWFCR